MDIEKKGSRVLKLICTSISMLLITPISTIGKSSLNIIPSKLFCKCCLLYLSFEYFLRSFINTYLTDLTLEDSPTPTLSSTTTPHL